MLCTTLSMLRTASVKYGKNILMTHLQHTYIRTCNSTVAVSNTDL